MKIRQAEFIISAVRPEQYPIDALPEIALAGRSNVGKSSLINCLIQRKNLARTSSTPGKTQTLNYYRINGFDEDQIDVDLHFVDLPGYGYAKVSQMLRQQWGAMIEKYLVNREQLKLILHLIDLRHPPTKDDQAIFSWLMQHEVPVCVVTTKADKIPKGKWQKHLKVVRDMLHAPAHVPVLLFSSEKVVGRDELWQTIKSYMIET